ncbi:MULTISPECIES: sensor histidine kinase [unclassified Xanthomonas]|uniref:sensor histidine kinase n=1 Tax=Xanthomonas sp. LMG 9002 TaxID=1591158 RepID=UPI00136DD141|nr:histidine kinase [Xanthomonas sp. LMG 9002]
MSTPKALTGLWVAFWLLMIGVSVQERLSNPQTHWWEGVLSEGSSAVVATVWIWLAVRVRGRYAAYLDRPLIWFGSYLRWLPVIAVTFIVAVYALRHGIYAAMGFTYEHPGWRSLFVYETTKLSVFVGLWLGILFGLESHDQWQLQRNRLLQTQKALAEAQLAQLQGQLRPHFLFNALNTVSSVMHSDVERADRLLAALGDLLRTSLGTIENEMTPLSAELRTLERYADIMRERFRDRVTLTWQVDPTLLDASVPALLLQPLLENAFKHAVEPTLVPVAIAVSARHAGGSLEIVVHNSCSALPASAPGTQDGVGLRTCRARLGILYGAAASLIVRNEGDGVAARVSIPLAEPRR